MDPDAPAATSPSAATPRRRGTAAPALHARLSAFAQAFPLSPRSAAASLRPPAEQQQRILHAAQPTAAVPGSTLPLPLRLTPRMGYISSPENYDATPDARSSNPGSGPQASTSRERRAVIIAPAGTPSPSAGVPQSEARRLAGEWREAAITPTDDAREEDHAQVPIAADAMAGISPEGDHTVFLALSPVPPRPAALPDGLPAGGATARGAPLPCAAPWTCPARRALERLP